MALFLTAVSLALHVRLGVGHWPRPMWEDYRTVGFNAHGVALQGVFLFAAFAALPLWTVCVCIPRFRLAPRTHLTQAGIFLLGWALVAGFVVLDPFQFVSWLAD